MFTVLNDTASEVSPPHKIWSKICSTWAVGLTVIVKVSDGPSQLIPLFVYVGVTVMFEIMALLNELAPVNAEISPFPDAATPVVVLSFVHESLVTPSVFTVLNVSASEFSWFHIICFVISTT